MFILKTALLPHTSEILYMTHDEAERGDDDYTRCTKCTKCTRFNNNITVNKE